MTAIKGIMNYIDFKIELLENAKKQQVSKSVREQIQHTLNAYYDLKLEAKELAKKDRTFLEKSFTKNDDLIDDINTSGKYMGELMKDLEDVVADNSFSPKEKSEVIK